MMGISVVIIVKNGGSILHRCLESLRDFDDVVLYNNGSTDDTALIAASFLNVRLIEGEFNGFGPTKNAAAEYAVHDWILSLDADEVLNAALVQEIKELAFDSKTVYTLLRKNFYKMTEIAHCWGADEIVRLYNRKTTRYSDKAVHEHILTEGVSVQKLSHTFSHYPYQSISEFVLKADRYSTLFAEDNVGKKRSSPAKAFFNGLYSFFRTYILKRGFLDGYAGLIIAFSHMVTNFYKYIKLYEMNAEQKKKTI
ncbi:MAG: glycosyl transferase [Sulfuricurvum sp. GWF2_44_89]|uniref:glycosyltransferase family 2 protein n=1 Tax=unclassified Sulfuricurvum TaxID=2632390 RepID=UPI0008C5E88F|nr:MULTISPECIES: glycosyltransferase family 2 protein [unclassified Sulfuricurvum]OHD78141.1 MAG: glycosyl transferase [Sulfuricurvum sp. GWF2_44_89]OHD91475.1 MAG: glycosyl transferase [Sulfuricurvum sp. RIFOXYD12_FULL_44_77]OHD92606.1 MAG: glycosyl transferase [Sulfuricurvum sp. RIFOXYD2_FULL_44_160]